MSPDPREPLENRINQEGNQWSCSLFSLKELSEGQTTVHCPWDGRPYLGLIAVSEQWVDTLLLCYQG